MVLLVGMAGCRSPKMDSQATARAYYRALAAGRGNRAYDLLDPSIRKQISRRTFVQNVKALSSQQRASYKKIASSKDLTMTPVLELRIDHSRTLTLKRTKKGWKIQTNIFAFYPQDTPRHALRSFLSALRQNRYHVLLRFVPRRYRRHMSEQDLQAMFKGEHGKRIRKLAEALLPHLDDPIEVQGNRATLVYGDGAKVNLVREEGVWRILDIQ